jgi:3,4-dihydroxy 2-butanone 4-phosphate synthase/GTP cyclohydrolase II
MSSSLHRFQRVEKAIKDFQEGRMLIMVDDENRENEGDLILAAQFCTPQHINFMVRHARGLVCLALEAKQISKLGLPMMTEHNQTSLQTAFTVSIEAKHGISTGISAHDRAHTIQTAIRDDATRADLVVPGHIFPLRAVEGGVLVRAGHTEGSVDLAKLAGLKGAAVICEVLKEDGSMARMGDLEIFAKEHALNVLSIADLIEYRIHFDRSLVRKEAEARLPSKYGKDFHMSVYRSVIDNHEHVAMTLGTPEEIASEPVLVRVHSECLTGDLFGSLRCDCGTQLEAALKQIAEAGKGVLIYLRQEGRGIGLVNKLKAYQLQDQGMDTVQANEALGFGADLRQYGIGAQILRDLGVKQMRLLSNNPRKIVGLESFGLSVVERVPLEVGVHEHNKSYMITKKLKMGHMLSEGEN